MCPFLTGSTKTVKMTRPRKNEILHFPEENFIFLRRQLIFKIRETSVFTTVEPCGFLDTKWLAPVKIIRVENILVPAEKILKVYVRKTRHFYPKTGQKLTHFWGNFTKQRLPRQSENRYRDFYYSGVHRRKTTRGEVKSPGPCSGPVHTWPRMGKNWEFGHSLRSFSETS